LGRNRLPWAGSCLSNDTYIYQNNACLATLD
jgi:hypothetical protein